MPAIKNDVKYDPPRLIPSIVGGFNAVASHIYIILFPVCLDLFFWFGPRVRVKKFFLPLMVEAAEISSAAYGAQAADFVDGSTKIWTTLLDQFSLLFSMRTFPIGIPSLMVGMMSSENPIGAPITIDLESGNMIMGWFFMLLIVGLLLGSIYFALTASVVKGPGYSLNVSQILNQTVQGFFLSAIIFTAVTLLALPVSCLLSSIMLVMPSLGNFPITVLGLIAVWITLPLVFSPHGIFFEDLKVGKSIVMSFRLVRSLMSVTGLFFILLILIGYGLDILWATPATDNWILAVGIIGHAFISTGVLAATFIYYDKGVKWLKHSVQPKKQENTKVVS